MSNFKSLQTKVETNLQAVLNASSMATNISKNSSLQTVIEKQLNILGFLERTNNVVKLKSTSFINKYKNLSNRAFVLDKQVTYSADDSLEDEVNYFPVFIQNIFHIDMASLIAGKEVQIDVPTVSDKPTYQNAFDSMSSNANKLFGTIAPEQNPLLINMAKLRIQKEMNEGKIYIYKTRPKIILLLKLLAVIVSLVGCVSNVILGVGMMLSRPMYTYDTGNAGGSLYGDAVMYFGMALILLWFAYQIVTPFISKKIFKSNDSRKFYFHTHLLCFISLFMALIVIFGGLAGDLRIFSDIHSEACQGFVENNPFAVYAWFIGYIVFFVILGLLTALYFCCRYFNPKQDTDLLNELTKKYIREMSSASTSGSDNIVK